MTSSLTSRGRARAVALLAAALTVLAVLVGPPAQAASFSGTLADAIARIPTAAEDGAGYDRTLFPHWVDADGDCHDTRAEVLMAEASSAVTFGSTGCAVVGGRWTSYYDRATWTLASNLDIDHLVPLAEARGSGASGWTTARRQAYANDLGDARSLVAVTDNVNQSKSDQDPAEWLPAYDRCRYVAEWVAVKIRWGLSADSAEKSALRGFTSSCTATISVTGA